MSHHQLLRSVKITGIVRETENAVSLSLAPQQGWKPHARSGQFITFIFNTAHGEKRRSYSLSCSPELNEPLRITVKKLDNGEFSRPLNYKSKPGDKLICTGIHGLFVLPEYPRDFNFVFLAAGSGITPSFSLIKTILYLHNGKILLVYSNKNKKETIFYEELLALKKKYPNRFEVIFLFSRSANEPPRRLSKWLLESILDRHVPEAANTLFYLCGPFEYMQMCRITLLIRVQANQIFTEDFEQSPPATLPEPPDRQAHRVKVHIRDNLYELLVQYPRSVTRTAKEMGIPLPYSCEAGRCASCVAQLVQGKMWMAYNQVLTDKEVQQGRVLTCQAFPVEGDAELRFDQ